MEGLLMELNIFMKVNISEFQDAIRGPEILASPGNWLEM